MILDINYNQLCAATTIGDKNGWLLILEALRTIENKMKDSRNTLSVSFSSGIEDAKKEVQLLVHKHTDC